MQVYGHCKRAKNGNECLQGVYKLVKTVCLGFVFFMYKVQGYMKMLPTAEFKLSSCPKVFLEGASYEVPLFLFWTVCLLVWCGHILATLAQSFQTYMSWIVKIASV